MILLTIFKVYVSQRYENKLKKSITLAFADDSKIWKKILYFGTKDLSLDMRIFTEQALREYIQEHPETKTALQEWKYVVRHSEWKCYADIKKDFNSVDAVGNQRYVFNIMGNHHRIVVVIKFTIYFVYIRFIGTHTEYERMNKAIGAKNI